MAHKASDGSMHTNFSHMKKHEAGLTAAKKAGPASPAGRQSLKTASGMDEEEKGGENDVSEQPIHEVVAEHGPAHEVHITHDHEANTHHVESKHGTKTHHSDHESAEDAHEHGKAAAGLGGEPEPDGDEGAGEYSLPGIGG